MLKLDRDCYYFPVYHFFNYMVDILCVTVSHFENNFKKNNLHDYIDNHFIDHFFPLGFVCRILSENGEIYRLNF